VPKRRVSTARQRAASARNLVKARAARSRAVGPVIGFPTGKAAKYTPPGKGGRRSKLGGKAYTKKSGTGVTLAPGVSDVLSGKKGAKLSKDFHPSAIRGEGVYAQPGGDIVRNHTARDVGHTTSKPLKDSPRGGGHKMAPSLKDVGAKPVTAKKPKPKIEMHGSGTGLTSAYRYLPVNVAARRKAAKKGRH
jgi:hypothetical protein